MMMTMMKKLPPWSVGFVVFLGLAILIFAYRDWIPLKPWEPPNSPSWMQEARPSRYYVAPPLPSIRVVATAPSSSSPSSSSSSSSNHCDSDPDSIFRRIFDLFAEKKIPLVLLETGDLISEDFRTYSRHRDEANSSQQQQQQQQQQQPPPLPKRKNNVLRLGVMGENATTIDQIILPEVNRWCASKIALSKTEETIADFVNFISKSRSDHVNKKMLVTNVFVVVRVPGRQPLPAAMAKIPFYPWRRLHLRFLHPRGVNGYRWMGQEVDDEGNYKLPAEAFTDFRLKPLVNVTKDGRWLSPFFQPEDLDFYLWEKKTSEFRECNANNQRLFDQLSKAPPKKRRLTDKKKIMPYMNSIMAVESVLKKHRIVSWLNCGFLLGWFRQCSIIPGDGDIDLNQWNSFDDYPALVDDFQNDERFRLSRAIVEYHPKLGHKRRGDQEGFYIRVQVKGGVAVDVYFLFKHKIYDASFEHGTLDTMVNKNSICSADLHGYHIHVPCEPEMIDEVMREKYSGNYMISNRG